MEIANLIAVLRAPDCDNCTCIECKPSQNLNRCNHEKTLRFIRSGYDMEVLK